MMKNFLCFVLTVATLSGLLPGYLSAQNSTFPISTNTTQWRCRLQNGSNPSPLTFAQANSGSWSAPVNFTSFGCQPSGTMPGTPITHSGSNSCSATSNTTRFFRTIFNLDLSVPICAANLIVRADNGFRVYVDGNVVPGTNTLGDAGEEDCPLVNSVIGDKHFTVYTVNIASFLNTAAVQHTLIIEVINCNYPTWLAARLELLQISDLDPSFTWTLTGSSTGGTLALNLVPNNTPFLSHHWLVEVSSSPNGPFTVFYNSQLDPVYRPGALGPVNVRGLPRSSYIRITHTVFHVCGSASTTIVIPTPDFQDGNDTYLSAASGGEINFIDESPLELVVTESIVADEEVAYYGEEKYRITDIDIFPNPFTDQFRINTIGPEQHSIRIYDNMGRTIMEKLFDESNTQELDVDMSGFATGIYRVSILDKSGNLIESKNVLKSN